MIRKDKAQFNHLKLKTMFQNPFSFEGRIRRTEYGLTFIIYFFGAVIINLAITSGGGSAIILLGVIPLIWMLWAQGAKRCHDRGNSGWFMFIPFYILWLLFAEGETGPNEYGPDPKGNEVPEEDNPQIKQNG
jgi:uncharacterized membrane protein YhaH (DUF805 family)